jgi:PAS domain S-box-containing protein
MFIIISAYWLGEGVLHVIVYEQEFFDGLFTSDVHELWIRFIITGVIVVFGICVQIILNRYRESRELYRMLFDNSPDAIFLTDISSGTILDVNPAGCQLLLKKREEIVGLHHSKLHPERMEEYSEKLFSEYVRELKGGKKPWPVEHVAVRLDGTEVPVETTAQIVHINSKPILKGIFRDITKRKETQAEMENLARFPSEDPNPVLQISRDCTILYANEASLPVLETWERKAGEFLPDGYCEMVKEVFDSGDISSFELHCHNGRIFSVTLKLVEDSGHVNAYGLDITQRKRSEDVLRESEHFLAKAQDIAHLGRWKLDPKTGVIDGSDELFKIFGLTKQEATLDSFMEIVHPEDRYYYFGKIRRGIEHGTPWDIESRLVLKDGTQKVIKEKGEAITDENGKTVFLVGTVQDVSKNKMMLEVLRESEERYRKVVEDQTEFIARWLPDGVQTFVNESYCRYFGKSRDELIGSNLLLIVDEADQEKVKESVRSFTPESSVSMGEYRVIRADGSVGWNQWTNRAIYDERGQLVEIQSVGYDITERKDAEKALLESKAKLQSIFDSSPIAITVTDLEGNITECNQATLEIHGFSSKEEIIGKNAFLFIATEDLPRAKKNMERTLKRGMVKNIEYTLRTKDGREFPGELSASLIRDNFNQPASFVAMTKDMTEWKKTEERLREERNKAQMYLDVAGVMFVLLDDQGKVALVNKKGCEILGYEESEIVGKGWFDNFIPEKDRRKVKGVYNRLMAGEIEPVEYFENSVLTKSGEERIIAWYNTFLRDDFNNIIGTISSGEDVTEHKRAEQQVQEHRTELLHVSRLSTVGEMASGLAHELNQPLCAILSYSNACLRSLKSEKRDIDQITRNLEAVSSQCKRAGEIVHRIRDFVQKRQPHKTTIEVNDLVQDVVSFVNSDVRNNNVVVQMELEEQLSLVLADAIQIEQVLLNLIRNSLDAMNSTRPDKRQLTIKTSMSSEDVVETSISDTGEGLPQGSFGQIFDPFFTTKPDGLGIGLSISRSIVENHGGNLWAGANPDCGSTFKFTLPVTWQEFE